MLNLIPSFLIRVKRFEISRLLEKAVISETTYEMGELNSSVFGQPKKDWSERTILNLENLNKCVQYNHFRM